MARPRKYVRVDGRVIDGVSFHKATNRYYIYDRRGKQAYFRTWEEASAAYRRLQGDPVAIAAENAAYAVRHAAFQKPEFFSRLVEMFGRAEFARGQLADTAPESRIVAPDGSYERDGLSIESFADQCGVPRFKVVEARVGDSRVDGDEVVRAVNAEANPKLRGVGEAWLRLKMNARDLTYVDAGKRAAMRAAKRPSPLTGHMRDTMGRWRVFVECVGNMRIADLSAAHFRKFFEWADREAASKAGGRWHGHLMAAIKAVFNTCLRHYADWAWPSGISERIRAYQPRKYEPPAENAEPMPAEVFRRLLEQCDRWAAVDPEQFDKTSQSGRARRLQALHHRREGHQMRVILQIAINCGLNTVDIERMRWSNLRLDERVPHLDLPRQKVMHSVGKAIERRIPLLPEVVAELRTWRAVEPGSDGRVFRTTQGTPVSKNRISQLVGRMLDDAGLERDFTFKHLRNVGPTLASDNDLPEEKIQRFLGHRPANVSNRYKGLKKPEYLEPVVELIRQQYFV